MIMTQLNRTALVVSAILVTAATTLMIHGQVFGESTTGIATICIILALPFLSQIRKNEDAFTRNAHS